MKINFNLPIQIPALKILLGISLACFFCTQSCTTLPQQSPNQARRIATLPGPEDMVLDSTGIKKSLLISCDDRRCESGCADGEILRYDLDSGLMDTLERVGEPQGMSFHPHGIDLVQAEDRKFLFVVNHDTSGSKERITKYQVDEDQLVFVANFENDHFRSPNAVCAQPDGGFWVSNDRWSLSDFGEVLLAKKKSTLVRVNTGGKAEVAGEKVAFGNGVLIHEGIFYRAATRANAIYRYPMTDEGLGMQESWVEVTGPDNLRMDGESVLVACHLRGVKFMRHAKDPKHISPTAIYRIPLDSGQPELLFFDTGEQISAGSTAIRVGTQLYISQVFEPWILEVDLSHDDK